MLNRHNTYGVQRWIWADRVETVRLIKREDDQRQGTKKSIDLYDCRWSKITKTGEPIQGDMTVNHQRTLHIPRVELDRVGVVYINSLDQFVDEQERLWQPEATTSIVVSLWENEIEIVCLRTDPPNA